MVASKTSVLSDTKANSTEENQTCLNGHIGEIRASDNRCRVCERDRKKARRQTPEGMAQHNYENVKYRIRRRLRTNKAILAYLEKGIQLREQEIANRARES